MNKKQYSLFLILAVGISFFINIIAYTLVGLYLIKSEVFPGFNILLVFSPEYVIGNVIWLLISGGFISYFIYHIIINKTQNKKERIIFSLIIFFVIGLIPMSSSVYASVSFWKSIDSKKQEQILQKNIVWKDCEDEIIPDNKIDKFKFICHFEIKNKISKVYLSEILSVYRGENSYKNILESYNMNQQLSPIILRPSVAFFLDGREVGTFQYQSEYQKNNNVGSISNVIDNIPAGLHNVSVYYDVSKFSLNGDVQYRLDLNFDNAEIHGVDMNAYTYKYVTEIHKADEFLAQ